MSFLNTLAPPSRAGAARACRSRAGSSRRGRTAYESGAAAVRIRPQRCARAFLDNPVAQRACGSSPKASAGRRCCRPTRRSPRWSRPPAPGSRCSRRSPRTCCCTATAIVQVIKDARGQAGRAVRAAARADERGRRGRTAGRPPSPTSSATATLTIPLEDEDGWPNLIHLKAFHPADDHYGAGCLAAAEQAVAIHNAAAQWNRALLENAARPSGALVYDAGRRRRR